jgi:hypothetical protein
MAFRFASLGEFRDDLSRSFSEDVAIEFLEFVRVNHLRCSEDVVLFGERILRRLLGSAEVKGIGPAQGCAIYHSV